MTIDDADLFDLAVWIAWKKHMIALSLDEYGFRIRRAFRTAAVFAAAATLGFRWAGPCGALILAALAGMLAIEMIFDASEEEVVCVAEFMLYSDIVHESHRKQIANVVRNAVTAYESAEFAVLSEMVGEHPALQHKIAEAIRDYLMAWGCLELIWLPEGKWGDPDENL